VRKLSLLLFAFASIGLAAETMHVSPRGKLLLQSAIDAARDGDTIILSGGTYVSAVPVAVAGRTGLTLKAEGVVWLVCQDLYADVLAVTDCVDLRIEAIRARHEEKLAEYECEGSVISARNVQGLLVSGCELAGSGAVGIDLSDCEDVEVKGCYLHDNSLAALSLSEVSSVVISSNRISNNAATMYSTAVTGLTMLNNIISDNGETRD
jgi:hypothetical protein